METIYTQMPSHLVDRLNALPRSHSRSIVEAVTTGLPYHERAWAVLRERGCAEAATMGAAARSQNPASDGEWSAATAAALELILDCSLQELSANDVELLKTAWLAGYTTGEPGQYDPLRRLRAEKAALPAEDREFALLTLKTAAKISRRVRTARRRMGIPPRGGN